MARYALQIRRILRYAPGLAIIGLLPALVLWATVGPGFTADQFHAGDRLTGTGPPPPPPPPAGGSIIAATRQPLGDTTVPNDGWANAGATVIHRTNQCGTTVTAPNTPVPADDINNRIINCSNAGGGVVLLGAGTFTLTTTISLKSNVTLRGQGMSTIVSFMNMGGSGHNWGAGQIGILVSGAHDFSGYGSDPGQGGATAANTRTWTGTGTNGVAGTYTQGATILNLDSEPTGLTVGTMLTLWQLDDADASLPHAGFLVSKKTAASGSNLGIAWQGCGECRNSAFQQRVKVTAINGSAVTVSPGVFAPAGTWRTSQTPKVSWQGNDIRSAGIEDMRISSTAYAAEQWSLIEFFQASDSWLLRTALQPRFTSFHAGGGVQVGVRLFESRNITLRSNWMDTMIGGGFSSTTSYGVSFVLASQSLVENNIFHHVESPLILNDGAHGNVIAYNYDIIGPQDEGGVQFHEVGTALNLFEGNETSKFMADVFHGNSNFSTLFRNHTYSTANAVDVWSYGRFWNVIGNVFNATARYQTLITDGALFDRWSGSCFRLGYNSQLASNNPDPINGAGCTGICNVGVGPDPEVYTSMFRWGNYCAADGLTRFSASEVPTGDATYPNAVPPTQTLPASLYLTARPAFFTVSGFGVVAWPPIGPDVTGGGAVGGRVHALPAQRVYAAASGVITAFNPSLYGT